MTWAVSKECKSCYASNHTFNLAASTTFASTNLFTTLMYEDGFSVAGYLAQDTFNLSGLTVTGQFINANSTTGFTSSWPADGTLGLGYVPYGKGPQPIINSLKMSGAISRGIFSLFMNDDVYPCSHQSVLTIGDFNVSYAYNLTTWPFLVVNNTYNANGAWNFPATSIDFNGTNVDSNTNIVLDSGNDWIFTSILAYPQIASLLVGQGFTLQSFIYQAKCTNATGYWTIYIGINVTHYLLIPPYRYIYRDNSTGMCYSTLLQGNDENWYIGDSLFRTYYTIFDVDRSEIAFAPISYFPNPIYIKRHGSSSDDGLAGWAIAVIVISCVLGVAAIGAIAYFVIKRRKNSPSEMGKPLQEVSLHA